MRVRQRQIARSSDDALWLLAGSTFKDLTMFLQASKPRLHLRGNARGAIANRRAPHCTSAPSRGSVGIISAH